MISPSLTFSFRVISFLLLISLWSFSPSRAQEYWHRYDIGSTYRVSIDSNGNKWFLGPEYIWSYNGAEWKRFSETDTGFPITTITCMESADDGSIWFGNARNGAVCFDGISWKAFNAENSVLGSDKVVDIAFGDDGKIWFITPDQCITLHDGVWKTGWIIQSWNPNKLFTCIAMGPGDRYYIGTNYSGLLYGPYMPERDYSKVRDILTTPDGGVVYGTDKGLVFWNKSSGKVQEFLGDPVDAVAEDNEGIIWYANYCGFYCTDGEHIADFPNDSTGIGSDNKVRDIAPDADGSLWFATQNGVFHFSGKFAKIVLPKPDRYSPKAYSAGSTVLIPWISRKVKTLRLEYSTNGGAEWNTISASIDAESRSFEWSIPAYLVPPGYLAIPVTLRMTADDDPFITHTAEIRVEAPGFREGFTELTPDNSDNPLHYVNDIMEDASGAKWIASHDLYRFDGSTWKMFTPENSGLIDRPIRDCAVDNRGNLWFAGYGGLSRYDGAEWRSWFPNRWAKRIAAGGDVVWAVCADSVNAPGQSSSTWSLYRFEADKPEPERIMEWEEPYSLQVSPTGDIWEIKYCKENEIWGLRLRRYDGFQWASYIVPESIRFYTYATIVEDSSGRIWGNAVMSHNTSEAAVFCFDDGDWKVYPIEGLNGHFNDMAFDRNGTLWCVKDDAIYTFDGNQWKGYDPAHGWPSPRISSIKRIFIDRNDVKWLIANNGLFRFDDRMVPVEEETSFPSEFRVIGNRPNPFNPSTTITFSLPAPGRADLAVYDITGRKVRDLVTGHLPAGEHSVVWDGRDVAGRAAASGVYFSRLRSVGRTVTGKMLLVR